MSEPSPFANAAKWFRSLCAESRARFVNECYSASPALDLPSLANRLERVLPPPLPQEMVLQFISGLAGLIQITATDEDFGNQVATYLARSTQADQQSPDKSSDAAELEAQFRTLLKCESSIGLTQKAQGVMWGHGMVFRDAHTITQIRPVFRADLEQQTEYAAIVHDLRIVYRSDGNEASFCVSLDRQQLSRVAEVIARAAQKEENLRRSKKFGYLEAT